MRLATEVRWRAKLAAKVGLSRLPIPYSTWRRLGLFRHGAMTSPDYAIGVFERAVTRAGLDEVQGLRVLELGPGDSLFSALVARAAGVRSSVLVDVGDYADRDLVRYRDCARKLTGRGYPDLHLDDVTDLDGLLARCEATYLTDGLESLRSLPSASIDFTWSQSTLEHVRRAELPDLLHELRRVTAEGGTASHLIDLSDHLGDGLNNLRFSERRWESSLMSSSGFYTNRVRGSEMLELFGEAGFEPEVLEVRRWDEVPTPRAQLAPEFRSHSDDELRARILVVRLHPV